MKTFLMIALLCLGIAPMAFAKHHDAPPSDPGAGEPSGSQPANSCIKYQEFDTGLGSDGIQYEHPFTRLYNTCHSMLEIAVLYHDDGHTLKGTAIQLDSTSKQQGGIDGPGVMRFADGYNLMAGRDKYPTGDNPDPPEVSPFGQISWKTKVGLITYFACIYPAFPKVRGQDGQFRFPVVNDVDDKGAPSFSCVRGN